VLKALRHGRIFRDGKTAWTQKHRRWVNVQRLPDALAQLALEQMLIHLDGIEDLVTRARFAGNQVAELRPTAARPARTPTPPLMRSRWRR
jgi:hypothetical protein